MSLAMPSARALVRRYYYLRDVKAWLSARGIPYTIAWEFFHYHAKTPAEVKVEAIA